MTLFPEDRSALRIYRLLLHLFPRPFRERRGARMERLFLDMREERRREGRRAGGPGLWIPLVWDTLTHGLRERLGVALGPGGRRTPSGGATGPGLVAGLVTDLRSAARSVVRQPLYAATIVLLVSLGIAGNAAVFRIFNGLFLRPLPFDSAGRLVDLDVRAPRWNLDFVSVAYPDFHEWRGKNETFRGMGAFSTGGANLAGEGEAIRVDVVSATHDLGSVLGLEPVLGRFFTAEEDVPDGARVAMVSRGLWERRYGRDPRVLGRTVHLDGLAHEVIGVLPPEADFVSEADVWVPLQENPSEGHSFYLTAVGRLRPGVSLERAEEDLTRVHKGMLERRPVNRGTFPVVSSLRDRYLGEYRLGGWVLMGAVGIVLLIACANIGGLMVARSLTRSRDMGIRVAMGAPRARIARQLLLESLVLSTAGAGVGAWLGFRGSSAMVARMADAFPRWVSFGLDWRFVAFTAGVTGATALLFGLAPALQMSGVSPARILQSGSARTTSSRGRRRLMAALVAGEVALAAVLLVAAGLAVQDLRRLQHSDPGFRSDNLLIYRVELPGARYADGSDVTSFLERHLERVEAIPGASAATATDLLPLSGHTGYFFQAEGAPPRGDDEANPVVLTRVVAPGYLETMGVNLLLGRGFHEFDGREVGTRAAVVNETFVREFLAHESDPLEGRIRTGSEGPWYQVVGVTEDVKHYGVAREMRPAVYLPIQSEARRTLQIAVRAAATPTALIPAVRGALAAQDPLLALFDVTTMEDRLNESLWTRRASSWLIAAFSTVALLLAVAGLYGVISYGVSQRIREIGIRKALGADRGRVVRQVVREGMGIVGAGVLVGLAGAWLAARGLSTVLVGVSATDPAVYVGVTALLLSVAALANAVPARRAARLDPMGVLRGE